MLVVYACKTQLVLLLSRLLPDAFELLVKTLEYLRQVQVLLTRVSRRSRLIPDLVALLSLDV